MWDRNGRSWERWWWFGPVLLGSKTCPHHAIAKIEALLLPVEQGLVNLDLLPLSSHNYHGLAHLLCPVNPPGLVTCLSRGFLKVTVG